ncbi:uncharacterized protein FIESC28_00392 [Fusarium coffeatum]|uniref:Peptidase S8/S53 domain-containing protein n=1 Tax=Fusarium coffeatum TaxID=231269 RepID=A0A366SBV1_9HYPO|nr:uncharacterized protein FIESC28_00392 [Fusarium coffeatum]RBR26811.1 hypothetical protein FIESC28_00392 [Fusarium coffeatum]
MRGSISSSIQSGKSLHEAFLQKGTDPSEVANLIKSTLGHEYISPWSDEDDGLVSAQSKATQDQVKKMKDHKDICNATGLLLSTILGDRLEEPTMSNGRIREWGAEMTDEQVAKVENLDGVEAVRRVYRGKRGRFMPRILKPSEASNLRGLKKRDIAYERQEATATELVAISQPSTVPDLTQLKNYVYESHGGSGSFVYHIETGVAYKAQNKEFPNVASQHLLTDKAIKKGDEPWVDDDDKLPSHGTCNAGKALGIQFGASKKATLVVVRLHAITHLEVQAAFELIIKDIDEHPERRKKGVISMALSFKPVWDQETVDAFRQLLTDLFAKDIPLISIAGNDDDDSDDDSDDDDDGRSDDGGGSDTEMLDSPDVDEYPGLMEGPDLPLIVVGSVDSTGQRSDWSKGGPHVTLHAVGQDILCLPTEGNVPVMENGTSYAGPLVAGEVANLLAYDTVPFDTSNGNLERVDGIRVLWNGVTQENNPKEAFECNGVGKNTYVEGDAVTGLIKDTFCSDLGTRQGLRGLRNSDYGESLKAELKGCALLPDAWNFVYGLGDDGREWTARFRTGVFQKKCVGDAVGMASGFGEFGCEGSGGD